MDKIKQLRLKHIPILLVGLILVFAIIVWVINLSLFDEKPSTGVIEVMTPHSMPPPAQNALFYLHGFHAGNDKDPMKAGQSLLERYAHNRDELGKDELSQADNNEILGGKDLDKAWIDGFERCRSRTDDDCFEKIIAQLSYSKLDTPRLSLMLERYQTLTQYEDFAYLNGFTFNSPHPGYATPMALQQLTLAKAAETDSIAHFFTIVEKDLKFWRMLLTKGNSLIDKMVAIAAIWTDLKFISAFINTKELNDAELLLVSNLLNELNTEEVDIGEAFIFESQAMYRQLENISEEELENFFDFSGSLMAKLIQTNATNNTHNRVYLHPLLELSKLTSEEFYIALPNGPSKFKEGLELSLSPSNLYNLGGKLLLQNSGWMASDYIARVHDLNGMFALVKLQLSLKNSPQKDWQNKINNSPFKNPYNNYPFELELDEMRLGFKCMNKGSSCRVKLY